MLNIHIGKSLKCALNLAMGHVHGRSKLKGAGGVATLTSAGPASPIQTESWAVHSL